MAILGVVASLCSGGRGRSRAEARLLGGALALLCGASVALAAAPREATLILPFGAAVPDVAGAQFDILFEPVIDDEGRIMALAVIRGAGVDESNNFGFWGGAANNLRTVMRTGGTMPGLPAGAAISSVYTPTFWAGRAAVYGKPEGAGLDSTNNEFVWHGTPGSMVLSMRSGTRPPGTVNGTAWTSLWDPRIDATGRLLAAADMSGPSLTFLSGSAVWTGTGSSISTLLRDGLAAPGLPIGTKFGSFYTPDANRQGQIAVTGFFESASTFGFGAWVGKPPTYALLAASDRPAPDLPSGTTFDFLYSNVLMNDDGAACFTAFIAGPDVVENQSDVAIFAGKPGAIRLVARTYDLPQGGTDGMYLVDFDYPDMDDLGNVAYTARLAGIDASNGRDLAVFHGPPGSMRLVAQRGTQAPGAASGVKMDFSTFHPYAMSRSGRLVMDVALSGPGVDGTNRYGLWIYSPKRGLRPWLRTGDRVRLSDGSTPKLTNYSMHTPFVPVNLSARAINRSDVLVLSALFDDGRAGVITMQLPPECLADFNADGMPDMDDVDTFVEAFEAGALIADVNGDGFLTFDDFDAFIAAFEGGC